MSVKDQKAQQILHFGEILWDQFPDYKRAGGSPFNVSIHLHYLKHHSYLISAVGNDNDGDDLLSLIEQSGASNQFVFRIDRPTGKVTVHIDEHNEPSYTINENVAWDFIPADDDLLEFAGSANAFSFATLSQRSAKNRESLSAILEALPKSCIRFVDLNLRPPFVSDHIISFSLHHSDFVKFNETEWKQISHSFQMSAPQHFLETFNLTGIIITKGGEGCSFFHRNGTIIHEPAALINESSNGDFVGVGDAFWACFIHHTLQKGDWKIALQKSNRYACWVAEQKGGIPDPDESVLKEVI